MSASVKSLVSPNNNENNLTKNISNKFEKREYLSKEELLEVYKQLFDLKKRGKTINNSQMYHNKIFMIILNDPLVNAKIQSEEDFDTLEFFKSRINYYSYTLDVPVEDKYSRIENAPAAGAATGTARSPIPAGRFTPLTVTNFSNKNKPSPNNKSRKSQRCKKNKLRQTLRNKH
jgi:hypothetical protein